MKYPLQICWNTEGTMILLYIPRFHIKGPDPDCVQWAILVTMWITIFLVGLNAIKYK